jgi:hypothetical protein
LRPDIEIVVEDSLNIPVTSWFRRDDRQDKPISADRVTILKDSSIFAADGPDFFALAFLDASNGRSMR